MEASNFPAALLSLVFLLSNEFEVFKKKMCSAISFNCRYSMPPSSVCVIRSRGSRSNVRVRECSYVSIF